MAQEAIIQPLPRVLTLSDIAPSKFLHFLGKKCSFQKLKAIFLFESID